MAQVLVIDGDGRMRQHLVQYLAAQGHDVTPASTGSHGAALFRQRSPDVLIISAELPDVDGLQLAQDLTAGSPTNVIILTSSAGSRLEEVRRDARAFGLLNFFRKPVLLEALHRQIERLCA